MKREGVVSGAEKLALLEELGMPAGRLASKSFLEVVFRYVHLEALLMKGFDERVAFAEELLGEDFEDLTQRAAGEIIAACEACGCEDRLVGYLRVAYSRVFQDSIFSEKAMSGPGLEWTLAALDAGLARLFVFGDPPGEEEGDCSRGGAEARRGG